MPRPRLFPRPMSPPSAHLFSDATEAWFWYVRAQRARREGARFESGPRTAARPCDPDDIYLAVRALYRRGDLLAAHLRTLARYGTLERLPDTRLAEERPHRRLWAEAMDRLGDYLRAKGIVE